MGRIAPRRRKSNRVYQPLLHTWLTIRQKIMPDPKAADEQNLMSEISAPEHTASAEDVILLKITFLQTLMCHLNPWQAPQQKKGLKVCC
jgi:cell envelope opacity-associated protein A